MPLNFLSPRPSSNRTLPFLLPSPLSKWDLQIVFVMKEPDGVSGRYQLHIGMTTPFGGVIDDNPRPEPVQTRRETAWQAITPESIPDQVQLSLVQRLLAEQTFL